MLKARSKTRKRHIKGTMNKAEKAYSEHLKNDSSVSEFFFESITLLLADNCRYTPDFMVQRMDGTIEFHEVKAFWKSKQKAHWEDDARVKIKVSAEKYPFIFYGVAQNGTKWEIENFTKEVSV